MIDFTTIDTVPTPSILIEGLKNLTSGNLALAKKNKMLLNVLLFTVLASGIVVSYLIYTNKNNIEDDAK